MTKLIFPTDEHHPYADHEALSVAFQISEEFNPDVRIAGSDGVDFYTLSKFDKDPSRVKAGGLQHEIDQWIAAQKQWRDATPNAVIYHIPGNHEDRLRRWLWRNPEVHGLRALELGRLLELDELGITEAVDDEVIFENKLIVKHGNKVSQKSAYTAQAELVGEHFKISTLTGHTHRGGTSYSTSRGETVIGVECFCLCRLDPDYLKNPDWQQGLTIAEVTPDYLSIEPIPFFRLHGKVRAIWRGKEFISK